MPDTNLSSFIWSVASLLRGDYKQSEYGQVLLPFMVPRRLVCALEATKPARLAELEKQTAAGRNPAPFLLWKSKQRAIELLHQFRTALISAVATGKIDVRGLAADEESAA